jgi:DNA-binding transcriptional regulator YiaG
MTEGSAPCPTVTETLRKIRRTLLLTQQTLAALLAVHPNTVAKWERGVARPRKSHRNGIQVLLRSAEMLQTPETTSNGSSNELLPTRPGDSPKIS